MEQNQTFFVVLVIVLLILIIALSLTLYFKSKNENKFQVQALQQDKIQEHENLALLNTEASNPTTGGIYAFILRFFSKSDFAAYKSAKSVNAGKNSTPKKLNPIILVPGLGGSVLYQKWKYSPAQIKELRKISRECTTEQKKWYHTWVSTQGAVPSSLGAECWKYRMTGFFDPTDNQEPFKPRTNVQNTSWRSDIPVRASYNGTNFTDDLGGLKGVDVLDTLLGVNLSSAFMFHNMIKFFQKTYGYSELESLFAIPYDFTAILNPKYQNDLFKKMQDMVEYSVLKNDGKKAFLIGHSLGCTTTKLFLNTVSQDWKDKHIEAYISLAGPYAGSSEALKTSLTGDSMGLGILCDNALRSTEECNFWYQPIEKYISGCVQMYPAFKLFNNLEVTTVGNKDYKVNDPALFREFKITDLFTASQKFSTPLEQIMFEPPNVKTYAITPFNAALKKNSRDQRKFDAIGPRNGLGTEISYFYESNTELRPTRVFRESFFYEFLVSQKKMTPLQEEIMKTVDFRTDLMIGDGTVTWLSLNVPELWKKTNKFPVITKSLSGDHKGIVDSKDLYAFFETIFPKQ